VSHEQRDVITPFAQGGEVNLHALDAEHQVFAELLILDQLVEVVVGRGDQTDIHVARFVITDANDLAAFENAQQLGLHVHGHVADLIKEQRAGVSVFKHTFAIAIGAGERALDVAEQFAFQDGGAQPGAVQRLEGLLDPLRVGMDRLGDQFLACAALAGDQDGDITGRDLLHGCDDALNAGRLTDDAFEAEPVVNFAMELVVLIAKQHGLCRAVDQVAKHVQVQWLLDEVVGAAADGSLGRRYIAVGGDHDRLGVGLRAAGDFQNLHAGVGHVHHQVGDDHVEAAVLQLIGCARKIVDDRADMAQAL
jgi:hypothetical protein